MFDNDKKEYKENSNFVFFEEDDVDKKFDHGADEHDHRRKKKKKFPLGCLASLVLLIAAGFLIWTYRDPIVLAIHQASGDYIDLYIKDKDKKSPEKNKDDKPQVEAPKKDDKPETEAPKKEDPQAEAPKEDPSKKPEDNEGGSKVSKKDGNHIAASDDISYDTAEVRKNTFNTNYKGKKLAFLTFDDGVNNVITPKVLDVLKDKNVKATFFVVGNSIGDDTAHLLKREFNEGHAIALHSFHHDYSKLYPNRFADTDYIVKEYKSSLEVMRSVLGKDFDSKVWRYPGGHMSWKPSGLATSDKALKEFGVEWIDWNAMNGDAQVTSSSNPAEIIRPKTVDEVIKNFDKSLRYTENPDQVVILMHDAADKELTAKALPSLIDHIKGLGYEFGILN